MPEDSQEGGAPAQLPPPSFSPPPDPWERGGEGSGPLGGQGREQRRCSLWSLLLSPQNPGLGTTVRSTPAPTWHLALALPVCPPAIIGRLCMTGPSSSNRPALHGSPHLPYSGTVSSSPLEAPNSIPSLKAFQVRPHPQAFLPRLRKLCPR